jgi:MarR family transcriptional regulator, organic hydroperoxide resistance regulator
MQTENRDRRPLREGGLLITQISQLSGRIFARKMRESGLTHITAEQGRILFVLWQTDNISIQELAKRTMLSKSTLTAMLDRLEDSGHVVRIPSRDDRRKIMICLTEKDRQLQEVYTQISREMIDLCYRGFREKEIDVIEQSLRRVLNNLNIIE